MAIGITGLYRVKTVSSDQVISDRALTTFPRWTNGPTVKSSRYIPVAGGVLGGYVLAHIGLLGMPALLKAGVIVMLGGYMVGVATLAGVLRAATDRISHAWFSLAAFCLGTLGLAAFLAWLFGAPADWAIASIKLGTFGFLLPMYFTVCHRMLPFFTKSKVPGYVMVRPSWSLPVVWALLLTRFLLDWRGQLQLLWLALDHLRAAQTIERAVFGGGHQPRAGIVGDARARPALERDDQGFLREIFGEPDITHESREATDQPRRFDAPDGLDGPARLHEISHALTTFFAARSRPAVGPPARAARA
jgi:hypothetical protein